MNQLPTNVNLASAEERHGGILSLIASDVIRYAQQAQAFQGHKPGLLRQTSILLTPSLICCALYRLAHALHTRGSIRLGRAVARANLVFSRALIEPSARIGPGLYVPHPPGIVFRGSAGRNLTLYTKAIVGPLGAPAFGAALDICPRLGDDVTLGVNVVVAGRVVVGSRVQMGPGVTILRSVPSDVAIIAPYMHARGARSAAMRVAP
ncbi:hypothetical protein DA075_25360 [Methylobacterium currus]|uniref:Serine acetyltransferase n=1 Tax=Methylobacterium currus TaxID=2051553 RepID=A0A2R4WQK3_9HYPH|nr:hypothetical protein [Methylobacterium currus]AWB23807.1 hypothetical protein DA075_25360 [Methylobacterium currus]